MFRIYSFIIKNQFALAFMAKYLTFEENVLPTTNKKRNFPIFNDSWNGDKVVDKVYSPRWDWLYKITGTQIVFYVSQDPDGKDRNHFFVATKKMEFKPVKQYSGISFLTLLKKDVVTYN